ncbi:MAG: methyltransferase, partial [Proteobacteria bacterium TMED51]
YAPLVSDWQNNENWQAAGAKSATERATTLWQSILADHESPALDPGVYESLEDYVARRKEEIGTGEP